MTTWILPVAGFCLLAIVLHFASTVAALVRCRPPVRPVPAPRDAPAVSIIRPVCGIDYGVEDTLRSTFTLDYPNYEIAFCVAQANDPVVPLVNRLMAQHPRVNARLLVGDERISINPKLNNCLKGWVNTRAPWVVMADANVLMPPDYLQRLFAAWVPGTGLVCAPPIGTQPQGFWADVECAFLNTYQARWQYFADTIGLGFAQGKTLFYNREILERGGGFHALASEVAEDAASTKIIRRQGLKVRLVDGAFGQPLGVRRAADVWRRQARWAQLRRASFPLYFTPEILSGGLALLTAGATVAAVNGVSVLGSVSALGAFWYGSELLLAYACGWPLSWRMPLALLTRDLMMPLVWFEGWRDTGFEWRGNAMRVDNIDEASTAARSSD